MPAESAVPFWGCLICANVHSAADSGWWALAWFLAAMAVLAVGVYKSK